MKEEVHSRTVIMARISADSNDLVKNQTETKQKKEKVRFLLVSKRSIVAFPIVLVVLLVLVILVYNTL